MGGWLEGYGYAGWKAGEATPGRRQKQPVTTEPESGREAVSQGDDEARQAARDKLIAAQDKARKDPAYIPIRPVDKTYCNQATAQIAKEVGAPTGVFLDEKGNAKLANDIAYNLSQSDEYQEISPEEAQRLANEGRFVVAAYRNEKGGSGHVASLRPEGVEGDTPVGNTGPMINNIGRQVGVMRRSGAFSKDKVVKYYAPK